MVDISKHPILKQCCDVTWAIEECGASEKLTEAVIKSGALLESIDNLLKRNNLYTDSPKPTLPKLEKVINVFGLILPSDIDGNTASIESNQHQINNLIDNVKYCLDEINKLKEK